VVLGFPQGLSTLEQFADIDMKKKLLNFNNSIRPTSAPYSVPKGVPAPASRKATRNWGKASRTPPHINDPIAKEV
jgi:hypothetical protein